MESAQISGNVFRFLSTMHPSLTKPERKRYSEFDKDKWYPWTPEIAGEFTELMKRSPRDTSFARGLAFVATNGLPQDRRMTPTEVVAGLATLPSAFVGPSGSGFEVYMDTPGNAEVFYRGMPGFSNVCIAIAGELTKRLLDVGARSLDVRHAEGCRMQGAEACRFEIRWAADPGEQASYPQAGATDGEAASPEPEASPGPAWQQAPEPTFHRPAEPVRETTRPEPPPRAAIPPRPTLAARSASVETPAATGNAAEDLFEQLRSRLVEAERQSARHAELEAHIAALEERGAELESALASAEADAHSARAELADLKRRLRELAG